MSLNAYDDSKLYEVSAKGNKSTGSPFKMLKRGSRVKTLALWGTSDGGGRLLGIRVTFEDGTILSEGSLVNFGKSIDFHPDEHITSTVISATDRRATSVKLDTNFGTHFEHNFGGTENKKDETKGQLVGVYGRSGADIDSLGLMLALVQPKEYEYSNVRYNIDAGTAREKLVSSKEVIIENPSATVTVTEQLPFTHSYTATQTWSKSTKFKLGLKTTINAGVPFVVDGKIEVSGEDSYSFPWGESVADKKTESLMTTITVPPMTRVVVTARATEGTIDVPFDADVIVRNTDGTTTTEAISDAFRSVSVGRFKITTKDY